MFKLKKQYPDFLKSVKYIKEVLNEGHILSQRILRQKDFFDNKGEIFTFLPEEVEISKLEEFNHAIFPIKSELYQECKISNQQSLAYPIIQDSLLFFAKEIKKFIDNKNKICILEDYVASSNYSYIHRKKTSLFYKNDYVYHYILHNNSISQIKNIVKKAKSIPVFIGIITSIPKNWSFPQKKEITNAELDFFVSNIKTIFVGVYDGESYLIWQKK